MTQLNLVCYAFLMNTTCNTETLAFFTGSSLFEWINLEEPSDMVLTEADLLTLTADEVTVLAWMSEADTEDAEEYAMLEAEYAQEQREQARDWAVAKSSMMRGGW